ncbi:hypothetical protein LPJ81_006866, partial [Coemansia sp. IMI 209127]
MEQFLRQMRRGLKAAGGSGGSGGGGGPPKGMIGATGALIVFGALALGVNASLYN